MAGLARLGRGVERPLYVLGHTEIVLSGDRMSGGGTTSRILIRRIAMSSRLMWLKVVSVLPEGNSRFIHHGYRVRPGREQPYRGLLTLLR